MELENYHEIVGTLERYSQDNNKEKLLVQISTTIELPPDAIPKEELEKSINRRIGILNCDGDYKLLIG